VFVRRQQNLVQVPIGDIQLGKERVAGRHSELGDFRQGIERDVRRLATHHSPALVKKNAW
jgi:hypothetical protein